MRRGAHRQRYQRVQYLDDVAEWTSSLERSWPRERRWNRRPAPNPNTPIDRGTRAYLTLWYNILKLPRFENRVSVANAVVDHLSRMPSDETPVLELVTGTTPSGPWSLLRMGYAGSAFHYEEQHRYRRLFPSSGVPGMRELQMVEEATSGPRACGCVAWNECA